MQKKLFYKILFAIVLFVIFPRYSFSQPFGGGVFVGGNFSQIDGDRFSGYNLPGFYGGGFVNLELSEKSKAQIEFSYIRKGAGNDFDETNSTFYKVKLDYIEMPVLLDYELHKRFRIHAGLAYGLLFKQTEDLDGAGDLTPVPLFDDYDFSGLAGFDFKIIGNLFITSRIEYSLLKIRSHPGNQTYFFNRGQYSNCISFSLRYHVL